MCQIFSKIICIREKYLKPYNYQQKLLLLFLLTRNIYLKLYNSLEKNDFGSK